MDFPAGSDSGARCFANNYYFVFSAPSSDRRLSVPTPPPPHRAPPLGSVFIALVISVNYGSARPARRSGVWPSRLKLWEKRAKGGEFNPTRLQNGEGMKTFFEPQTDLLKGAAQEPRKVPKKASQRMKGAAVF